MQQRQKRLKPQVLTSPWNRTQSSWMMQDGSSQRVHHRVKTSFAVKDGTSVCGVRPMGNLIHHFHFLKLAWASSKKKKKNLDDWLPCFQQGVFKEPKIWTDTNKRWIRVIQDKRKKNPRAWWPIPLLTPSILQEAPRDHERGRRVLQVARSGVTSRLTECQYKAIYKRMKNRPSITGNFSARLPQEAWPALQKWEWECGGGGAKTRR